MVTEEHEEQVWDNIVANQEVMEGPTNNDFDMERVGEKWNIPQGSVDRKVRMLKVEH